jgi:hypothetical protein
MWPKAYKDYPVDSPLVKDKVESGQGIIGCEMHDLNGWGDEIHIRRKKKKKGFFRTLFAGFLDKNKRIDNA